MKPGLFRANFGRRLAIAPGTPRSVDSPNRVLKTSGWLAYKIVIAAAAPGSGLLSVEDRLREEPGSMTLDTTRFRFRGNDG